MTSLRVHVHGAGGRMGVMVVAAIREQTDLTLVGTSGRADDLDSALAASRPDVLVEFTVPTAVGANLRTAIARGVSVVSGTTGISNAELDALRTLAASRRVGVVLAPNFSLGVVLMQRFAKEAIRHFPDAEIVELHHDKKLDAPSGTAIHTARMLGATRGRDADGATEASRGERVDGIPVHAIRLPGLLAHQEILFGGLGQLLTIRHDAFDRRAYAPGILLAIRRVGELDRLVDSLEPLLAIAP